MSPRVLAIACVLGFAGCASVGPPLPPALHIPTRVSDLTAVQRGSNIIIQFTMPASSTEGLPLAGAPVTELRIGVSGPRFDLSTWLATSRVLPDQGAKTMYETPAAEFAGKDVVIAVRLKNPRGRDAGWSNFFPLGVTPPVPQPQDFRAAATAQGVELTWTASPASLFRVFRKGDTGDFALLAETPKSPYLDATAASGKPYTYFVQAVEKAGAGASESDLSEYRTITPIDTFPPAVPANLKAIAGAKSVEVSWNRSTEPDMAGYHLFRAVGDGPFTPMEGKLTSPSYSDRDVVAGQRYRYAVSAFDQSNNESARSSPVEVVVR